MKDHRKIYKAMVFILAMFGWLFTKKVSEDDFEQLKAGVQTGFNTVKQDINKTGTWIKHLDDADSELKQEILELNDELSSVRDELENLKNMVSIVGERPVFKQQQTVFSKQPAVQGVLNSVQTGVQTVFLDNLSTTERAIVFVLLNSDLKLSYEDLAAMLGKRKATVRGQINSIRQKSEGLIKETIGVNNKKRVFIPDDVKATLLKTKKAKSKKNKGKVEEYEDYV